MGQKMRVVMHLRFVQDGVGGGINLLAQRARPDRLHRGLLDGFDFGQKIDEFGVRLADDAHAATSPI